MRVEVLGGVERRRRWSRDDKMRIIEETLAPGAVVTEIARRHGIATSLVFTWRRRARLATVASAGPRLVPVRVAAAAAESVRSIEAPAAIPVRKVRCLIEIGRGVDLSGPDGLYAGRHRLEKSATDMAAAERRLSQIKYWTTCILGRHKSLNL